MDRSSYPDLQVDPYDDSVSNDNVLGNFLRARRDSVTPGEVGLTSSSSRRVSGLRREELALLAGISADYYLRLEQGRDQHPSPQVLDALARALMLDSAATTYLHQLAYESLRPPQPTESSRKVSPGLLRLIDSWPMNPTHVQGADMTVLASNRLARAISPTYAVGTNGLRSTFLDPSLRALYRNWESMAERVVAGVRAAAGPLDEESSLAEIVSELREVSPDFVRLWDRHEVHPQGTGVAQLHHPEVGPMDLAYEKFRVEGADGQQMVVFYAEQNSGSEFALQRLTAGTSDRLGSAQDVSSQATSHKR
jgi:transcriptional regulator with XRE-family HTH domain